MDNLVICIVVLSAFVGYTSAVNCTTLPDGIYELDCKSFAKCVGSRYFIVNCPQDTVYNSNTGTCDDPQNGPALCGHVVDCSGLADGRYPSKDQNCESYYTCEKGKFLGHNACPKVTRTW